MKYKMMAVDMDGTLLNDSKEISPRTAQAIRKAVAQGFLFTLCTGRPIQGVERYSQFLGLQAPLITYNGAMIIRSDTKEILYKQELLPEDIHKILEFGRNYNTTMCIWSGNRLYGNVLNNQIHAYKKNTGVEPVLMEDEDALIRQGVTKILWIDTEEKIKKIQEELPGDAFSQVTFCTSQTTYLEFFNSQVSKAKAMERLGQLFNIRQEEMIAVGDGLNDLPMIEYAGLGVAMENAQAQVKTRARYITSSNEEDGVGKVLEKFVLI